MIKGLPQYFGLATSGKADAAVTFRQGRLGKGLPVSSQADVFEDLNIKPSRDGRFRLKSACKNFLLGAASPVTTLFKSVENFTVGAAMIGIGLVAIQLGGGPLLVAMGLGLGVMDFSNFLVKLAKAQGGDDVEEATFHLGSAMTNLIPSILGAKSALRMSGVTAEEVKAMGLLESNLRNLRNIPASLRRAALQNFKVLRETHWRKSPWNYLKSGALVQALRKFNLWKFIREPVHLTHELKSTRGMLVTDAVFSMPQIEVAHNKANTLIANVDALQSDPNP